MNGLSTRFSQSLAAHDTQREWLATHRYLIGDIHNHCSISYGHGELADAVAFARQQLDFFSVTGHFAWPDMVSSNSSAGPSVSPEIASYHEEGFSRLRSQWNRYRRIIQEAAASESCIPFLSYEYHSFSHGDYTIVLRDLNGDLPASSDTKPDTRLQRLLETTDATLDGVLCIPHHIGYRPGYRGIVWETFSPKASPVVEIMSMHGCAESHRAPLPYLHTMGPRTGLNTMQGGLSLGHRFGVIGSTDHHNASPGSYGFGRAAVWASSHDRLALWDGLSSRRTCALTGDPIEAALFVDDAPIGSCLSPTQTSVHSIDAYVAGCDTLERVEILQNNQVVSRVFPADTVGSPIAASASCFPVGRIGIAFGWGEKHSLCHWHVSARIERGVLLQATPRLRGEDIVDPLDEPSDTFAGAPSRARFEFLPDSHAVTLDACTTGNPNATTNVTQGFSLEISGDFQTTVLLEVQATWHDRTVRRSYAYSLTDLLYQPISEYVDGFVSPALSITSFVPLAACTAEYHTKVSCARGDWIYLRAFQSNGDCVWTSPVWV